MSVEDKNSNFSCSVIESFATREPLTGILLLPEDRDL